MEFKIKSSSRFTRADLKRVREARGWTRKELAEALGVSYASVVHWENGIQRIPAERDAALGALLGGKT